METDISGIPGPEYLDDVDDGQFMAFLQSIAHEDNVGEDQADPDFVDGFATPASFPAADPVIPLHANVLASGTCRLGSLLHK